MPATPQSNTLLREGLKTFSKGWYKAIGLFAIPVIGIALILFLGNISGYLSLILFPLMVPFLYNAYRYFWTSRDTSGSKLSFSFNEYYSRPGARGSLGVLAPVIWSVIVTDLCYYILFSTLIGPLLRAFGNGWVWDSINSILNSGGENAITQLLDFLNEPGVSEAFSAPLTICNGIALYLGLVLMLALCDKNRFNYAIMTRILPDCDNNLAGTQARLLGKGYMRGLYWKRIGMKIEADLPMFVILSLIFGGAIAGFSFVSTSMPQFSGSLPIIVVAPFGILAFAIDASFDIPIADALIADVIENNGVNIIEPVRNTFRSPEYVHTADRAGMVPFQGLDSPGPVTAADFDATAGFYQSEAGEKSTTEAVENKVQEQSNQLENSGSSASGSEAPETPTNPENPEAQGSESSVSEPSSTEDSTPTSGDSSSEEKNSGASYGVIDFSMLSEKGEKDDGRGKEE